MLLAREHLQTHAPPQQPLLTKSLLLPRCCSCGAERRSRSIRARASSSTSTDVLKAELLQTVTRLNSADEADDPQLQAQLLSLVNCLADANPTPRPAESSLINGRWALLYTLPGSPPSGLRRSPLAAALATAYDFFYRYVPILAGSAVGRKADSRRTVRARGQFQTFDTTRGWVGNQARFEAMGRRGLINVDGPARISAADGHGRRIEATFTVAELSWGDLRVPFPISIFSPSGFIDTLFLDEQLRISKGDKGSYFIASRAPLGDDDDAAADG